MLHLKYRGPYYLSSKCVHNIHIEKIFFFNVQKNDNNYNIEAIECYLLVSGPVSCSL